MNKKHKNFIIIFTPLVMVASFLLGRISVLENTLESHPIEILSASQIVKKNTSLDKKESPVIRASSRGSKYYFPWCLSSFSEANTIYFSSEQEAIDAGYEKAVDCIGL